MTWKERYREAYNQYQEKEYPSATKGYGYLKPKYPDVETSNGLTRFVIDFCKFSGHYSNRINTSGRQIFDKKKNKHIWIKASTLKGTADTMIIVNGHTFFAEIKVGRDTPGEKQLEQQARIQASGAGYYFIHTPEEFLEVFDKVVSSTVPNNTPLSQ